MFTIFNIDLLLEFKSYYHYQFHLCLLHTSYTFTLTWYFHLCNMPTNQKQFPLSLHRDKFFFSLVLVYGTCVYAAMNLSPRVQQAINLSYVFCIRSFPMKKNNVSYVKRIYCRMRSNADIFKYTFNLNYCVISRWCRLLLGIFSLSITTQSFFQ